MKILNKRPKQSLLFLLCGLLGLLLFSGCKTSRKLTAGKAGEAKEASEFFYSIQKEAFSYQTLSARIHAELNFPRRDLSSRVDIKIIKDSVFQLSVLPLLGVEVFRIEFNTDSVKVIDRINKSYIIESYAGLKRSSPIEFNFYNLQALFTNHIFIPGEQDITPRQYDRFTLKQEGNVTEAQIKDAMKLLYAFKADSKEKLLSTRVTDPSERYMMQWIYTDFRPTEEQYFPMQMEVQMLDDGIPAGEMKLSFSHIRRNLPLRVDFPIPQKYKRTTFAEIIKAIR
ncbi:MAG: DUF4292 domain-containing protein [Tannerellaceae bacterium]|jgi:hypothetical protein|nr:DUF4292 domain-containing protein [Tannerellaceae bacterium]